MCSPYMSILLSECHPGFIFDSDRCLQTACLAAALSALVPGAHPVLVMDSLFIQLFLGQKEEISMENGSLSLPLLSSLTLPQGSTNSPPPQADRICQLAHLLMCERPGTGHPSSATTAVRMRASVQTYVYVSQIYHVVWH